MIFITPLPRRREEFRVCWIPYSVSCFGGQTFIMKKFKDDPGDKMGFPPGVAQNMIAQAYMKYRAEHYKKFPPKSKEEYQQKLQQYQKVQEQQKAQEQQQQKKQQTEQQQIKQVHVRNGEFNTYNGGKTEKYEWSQNSNDVTVGIDLPQGTTKKDVLLILVLNDFKLIVSITNTELSVRLKSNQNPLINGKLYDKIKQDDSMWSIEDNRKLLITLEKCSDNIWKTVIQGDQEIDATKVENSKPLDEFDPETQGALRKIMYEQQRKNMGLPTTEEESQLNVLEQAWNAEGSPFKGQPFDPSKFNLGGNNSFNI